MYTFGTMNSICVEIQPNSTNIKNAPRKLGHEYTYTMAKEARYIAIIYLENSISKLKSSRPTSLSPNRWRDGFQIFLLSLLR